jgi:hypothetical protein
LKNLKKDIRLKETNIESLKIENICLKQEKEHEIRALNKKIATITIELRQARNASLSYRKDLDKIIVKIDSQRDHITKVLDNYVTIRG